MRILVAVVLLAAGCTGKDSKGPPAQPIDAATATDTVLPAMPAYPSPARGRLAVRSAGGPYEITGEWPAEAGTCDQPPMAMIVAQVQGTGTIVLLALPDSNRVGTYPVTIVGAGLPRPPASQVGVQLFRPGGPTAYQGAAGAVEVYAYDKTVSGRFAVTLREINSNARVQYAGAFREIPLAPLDPSRCAMADSTARAPARRPIP